MLGFVVTLLASRDRGSHQHDGQFDFTDHEALFEAEHADIVAAADAHLRGSDGLHWPLGGALVRSCGLRRALQRATTARVVDELLRNASGGLVIGQLQARLSTPSISAKP